MERKTTDRKKVDAMLVELEAFVTEFGEPYPSVRDLFSVEFRRNAYLSKGLSKNHQDVELPNLSVLANAWSQSYVKISAKNAEDDERRRCVRKSQFVQRVAYGMKMACVPELGYRQFFFKFCLANGCNLPYSNAMHGFLKDNAAYVKEILVPEEWIDPLNKLDYFVLY